MSYNVTISGHIKFEETDAGRAEATAKEGAILEALRKFVASGVLEGLESATFAGSHTGPINLLEDTSAGGTYDQKIGREDMP